MKDFQNKVVVITGAGSGIGRALAIKFNSLGAKLALNDFNAESLEETIGLINAKVYSEVFDVSKKEAFFAFAQNIKNHYGRVDVVINNAGVAITKLSALKTSIEDYEWIMGINLWGMMYGSLAFLPFLREQQESSLVNLSSLFGLHGIPFQAAYSTTKFGIRGFTEAIALEEEVLKTGVSVTSVHPGGIKTNIAKNARHMDKDLKVLKRFEKSFITSADKAALTIINGINKKKKRVVVGPDAKILFFISKVSQRLFFWVLKRA